MFIWTLVHQSILTNENLRKRGWEGPSKCPLCCNEEESTYHLLLLCPFVKEVWEKAVGLDSSLIHIPQDTSELMKSWSYLSPFELKNKDQLKRCWLLLPKFVLWKIWLVRNNRLFRDKKCFPAQVAVKARALLADSLFFMAKGKNSTHLELEEALWIKSIDPSLSMTEFNLEALKNGKLDWMKIPSSFGEAP